MPEPLRLHINHYDFTIPARYTEGHVMTAGEARALNQLMMENIRNNVAPWVRAAEREAPGGILPLAELQALEARILEYARNYQFLVRNRQAPLSAVEAAMHEIAMSETELECNSRGWDLTSPDAIRYYRNLLTTPEVRNRARQVVADRVRTTRTSLDEILEV